MVVGVQKAWSLVAATNGSADTNINYAEGASFKMPQINDSARAAMAAIKGWSNQLSGGATYGGSADAYTVTSDAVAAIATAYAAGMQFMLKANHTNTTTTPTLNVDGVGAVTITRPAGVACAAGDIVSGGLYVLAYNTTGPRFELVGKGEQPLDATLTALAALSWSSGNALVQFTAADTVSLTLTPSVNSVTATSTVAATHSVTAKNTTDNANVAALRIEGDRANPAANDQVYASFILSDSAGNQDEFARISAVVETVTSGAEAGQLRFAISTAGVLAEELVMTAATLAPLTNGGLALGTVALGYAGAHFVEGAAINWDNGDAILTQTGNVLELTGAGMAAPLGQVASVGGETLTAADHRNRQLLLDGNITLPNAVFAAGDWHVLSCDGTNRTITRGASVTMYVNGVDSASATLPARQTGGAVWETASVVHLTGPIF